LREQRELHPNALKPLCGDYKMKKMKKISALIPLMLGIFSSTIQAQKEGNIWHFGQGAALDFNSGTAVVTTPSSMWTFEGCASIADANGNLLFYSNGGGRDPILSGQPSGQIWNRDHQVMYDMGNTQGGGFSAAQSSVIIPKPGDPNNYILFTMEEMEFDIGGGVLGQPAGRGLSYFEVDMSLNGGLGEVVNYAGMIQTPSYEGLCAIRHTNGSDYWIIVHNDVNGLAVFPMTSSGIQAPVIYDVPGGTDWIIKGSPDGKWVSVRNYLFPFDATNGTIGSTVALAPSGDFFEFSSNSKRLYTISGGSLIEYYDLTSPNIIASKQTVEQLDGSLYFAFHMQLAPDGKIYFIVSDLVASISHLYTIECPNSAPYVVPKVFSFDDATYGLLAGLPNFDNAIFRRDEDPSVNLGEDQKLCDNDTLVLDAGIANATYQWSNGAQTQTLDITAPGTYTVTVTAGGCGAGVDSITVSPVSLNLNAGPDQTICKGDTLALMATGNGPILWAPADLVSNSSIPNPLFTGNESALLVATIQSDGCVVQDSVVIVVSDKPNISLLPADTTINAGASVPLVATGDGLIQWSPTEGLSCTDCPNPVATPTATTTYSILVTNDFGCNATESVNITVISPDCNHKLPNAFTPDGDTANDEFKPLGTAIESYNLTIYNRWGQEIFNGNAPWNGRYKDQDAPCDVYIYTVDIQICGKKQTASGSITLIR
jgi:gliding motility-associated-like protein